MTYQEIWFLKAIQTVNLTYSEFLDKHFKKYVNQVFKVVNNLIMSCTLLMFQEWFLSYTHLLLLSVYNSCWLIVSDIPHRRFIYVLTAYIISFEFALRLLYKKRTINTTSLIFLCTKNVNSIDINVDYSWQGFLLSDSVGDRVIFV